MSTLGTLATTHTVVDDKGLVRLISDQDGYAQIENELGKIFALKDSVGKAYAVDHSSHSDIGLWEAVAAETIEGQNSVAWKQFRLGNLYAVKVYKYNPFWIEQFGSSGSLFPGTTEFLQAEENFEKDFDVIPIQKGSNQRIGHFVDSDFNINQLMEDYSYLGNDFCC